jgi:hypothetical protein
VRGLVEVVLGFAGMVGVFSLYLCLLLGAAWLVITLVRFVPLVGRRGRKGPRQAR